MISLALGAILAALAVLLTALPFIQHADDLDASETARLPR